MRWITSLLVVVGGYLSPAVLEAAVNLSLQPQANPVQVGQTARIDLIAANTLGTPQEVAAVDAIVQWDPAVLQLLGYTNPTPDPWMFHGFLPDPCGLNDVLADGEALYTALAPPPPDSAVVPAFGSIVVTTFEFTALQTATGAPIDLVIQQADCTTRVFAPSPPQTNLLGAAAGTAIDIVDVLPLGRLALEADFCQLDAFPGWPGDQIVIQLHMRNLQQPVTGFQAFLEYDHDRLAYCGSLSAYTASPFGVHVQPVLTAEVSPGWLRLDGSTFGPGTSSEAMLAALVFTVYPVGECTICCSVVFDLNQPFPSELSYQGVPVPTALSNSAVVFLDGDGPVFTDHPDSLEVCAPAATRSSRRRLRTTAEQ